MECAEVSANLKGYLHGELEAGMMRGVQLHVGGCASCRNLMKELRHTADVVVPYHMVGMIHGELSRDERKVMEAHMVYCEPCRQEFESLRLSAFEMIKNLSQYQLTRTFRTRVMQEWKPHRVGRRARYSQRGLADLIERAEAGNTFSYERHIDRFKDYAYLSAFLLVKDFHWATEIAAQVFIEGMPAFNADLTQRDFLKWLHDKSKTIAKRGSWLGKNDNLGDTADGLSGYEGSRKLRRHRLVLDLVSNMDESDQMAFLLSYVQRLNYSEIDSLLEIGRGVLMESINRTTRQAMGLLHADDMNHPRRRKVWER